LSEQSVISQKIELFMSLIIIYSLYKEHKGTIMWRPFLSVQCESAGEVKGSNLESRNPTTLKLIDTGRENFIFIIYLSDLVNLGLINFTEIQEGGHGNRYVELTRNDPNIHICTLGEHLST
jgi:hypothetical protein